MTTVTTALVRRRFASTLLEYGMIGMPRAIGALPLYVHLPKFYGDHLVIALAVVYASALCVFKLGAGGALLWLRRSQQPRHVP